MNTPIDHNLFRQRLDAYLADGLSPREREEQESHAAMCAACAALLDEARRADAVMNELFATVRPDANFESRLLARLNEPTSTTRPTPPRRIHPLVFRVAGGVAATVLLGGTGYVVQHRLDTGLLPTPWAAKTDESIALAPPALGVGGFDRLEDKPAVFFKTTAERGAAANGRLDTPAELAQRVAGLGVADHDSSATDNLARNRKLAEVRYRQRGLSAGAEAAGVDVKAADKNSAAAAPSGGGVELKQEPEVLRAGVEALPKLQKAQTPTEFGAVLNGPAAQPNTYNFQPTNLYARFGERGETPPPLAGALFRGLPLDAPVVAGKPVERQPMERLDRAKDVAAKAAANGPSANDDALYSMESTAGGVGGGGGEPAAADRRKADTAGVSLGRTVEEFDRPALKEEVKGLADKVEVGQNLAGAALAEQPVAKEFVLAQAGAAEQLPTQQSVQPLPVSSGPANPAERKIIRNGEMSFEVDGFDSALLQIGKIAQEEGGFIATTASEKLPNGKVKGSIVVRVPPERLDTLVLKLRGLGDLKASRIGADDVTKQYTDLASQLRAAQAMENRLLEIIKTGKGEIKDLVVAEKQLGEWREKIERLEGEIRYYNNLISLSTLTVNLTERDIRNAAMVSESEQVNMGVESEDVEKARAAALKAIEEAKGRIIESDLKKLEAGQFLARVSAEVKPDAAGPLIDRLKQIGRVARLEIERRQKSPDNTIVPPTGVRVERADTRLILSIYNLANVAPRVSTSLNLAAPDVETAYRAILDQIKSAGGRVVTSQLNRQGAAQTTGTITFESPTEQADVLLGAVRAAGEVMKLDVQQNPDAQNTTEAKRGFAVQIYSLAAAAPRETMDVQIAVKAVADAFNVLREAVRSAEGRVLTSQLAASDPTSATGQLVVEVSRQQTAAVEQALRQAGDAVSRNANRAADAENTVDTKVRYSITLTDEARLTPRQSVDLKLAVKDVQPSYAKLLEAIQASGARVLQSQLASDQQANSVGGTLVFDVRGDAARAAIEKALVDAGDVYARSVTRSADAQGVVEDKTRLTVTILDATRLSPRETTTIGVEVSDVERSKGGLEATAVALGGTSTSTIAKERDGRTVAQLTLHVPLAKKAELLKTVRDQGKVLVVREENDANVPPGQFARARLNVTLGTPEQIVSQEDTLVSSIRRGLGFSAQGLLWSLQWVIVGLCFVLPWVAVGWIAWRLIRRSRRRGRIVVEPPPPTATPA